ncbi:MAG: DUF2914 domain-containing protein [Desulfobulbaceae bacterium]|nr:DUF2914 domain-containing protein [Desulfobulbaceae bacterium]
MKRGGVFLCLFCVLFAGSFFTVTSYAVEGSVFTVSRLVICENVVDREPVEIINTVASGIQEVSCFLEATDIVADTMVNFVWIHEGTIRNEVTLPVKMGPRWRTYVSKKLGTWTGNWTVELRDANGSMIDSVAFVVE